MCQISKVQPARTYTPTVQQFSKFGLFCADFRLRTCRTACGPADVRHAQLTAQTKLKFEKSACLRYTRCCVGRHFTKQHFLPHVLQTRTMFVILVLQFIVFLELYAEYREFAKTSWRSKGSHLGTTYRNKANFWGCTKCLSSFG